MKNATLFLAILFSTSQAFAVVKTQKTTFKASLSCQQTDGDHLYEVGLAPSKTAKSGFDMLIVRHNEDDQTTKLVELTDALVSSKAGQSIYKNEKKTIELAVNKDLSTGEFTITEKGTSFQTSAECFKNSKISYEYTVFLEPRLGVGN